MSVTAVETSTATVTTLSLEKKKAPPTATYRKDYQKPAYSIDSVFLDFKLDAAETIVKSELQIFKTGHGEAGDLRLDGENLELVSVSVEGVALPAKQFSLGSSEGHDPHCVIIVKSALPNKAVGEKFSVKFEVKIRPDQNTDLSGLYKTGVLLATQCEAEGFRRITYFLDRPDVMAKYRVRLEGDKTLYPVLLSNGDKVEFGDLSGTSHFATFVDPFPKPSYLFAIVGGNLKFMHEKFTTMASQGHPSRDVDLFVYSEPEFESQLEWALASVKSAMKWDERRFGRVYDLNVFNVVALSDFNMGAMENKGLNIFNTACILATKERSTDADFERVQGVIGHEYFHNWSGDRVTCRDWFQLTLKEGLTVFRDQEFSRDLGSPAKKRIEDVSFLRSMQFKEDSGPMSHPIRPESYIVMDNFYTLTVYEKGAEVIRMYQTLLGKEGFRKALDFYFDTFDGQAVSCDDFRWAMAQSSGRDLSQFELWYSQRGTPTVEVTKRFYDKDAKQYHFCLKQVLPLHASPDAEKPAQAYHIPVRVGLIGKSSKTDVVKETVFELTQFDQTFTVDQVEEDVVPSIFRDFSAPVKVGPFLSDDELAFLMAYDTDPFNKWEAGQIYMKKLLVHRAVQMDEGKFDPLSPLPLPDLLVEAFRNTLSTINEKSDLCAVAYSVRLPGVAALEQEMSPCNPLALHKVRAVTKTQLGTALKDVFTKLYEEYSSKLTNSGEYEVSVTQIGLRCVRNYALDMLCAVSGASELEAAGKLALNHFRNSHDNNYNDCDAALTTLADMDCESRTIAFEEFYTRAKSDALVLDKWFRKQALAAVPDVLKNVELLSQHKDFKGSTNPNRIRSLIGAFSFNPLGFHAEDGSGYKFIADKVIEMDSTNSHLASGFAKQLIEYKTYDKKRQDQIREQLTRIHKEHLSNQVFEIVQAGLKA